MTHSTHCSHSTDDIESCEAMTATASERNTLQQGMNGVDGTCLLTQFNADCGKVAGCCAISQQQLVHAAVLQGES
jgi:hypothetical protein